jgi:LacI family transcriptional regulator
MTENEDKLRIKDIARLANISAGTVDRVLHNRGEVRIETREKVLKIIDELGYTPNLLAKSLALKKTFRVCVLVPFSDEDNRYWNKPLEGLERAKHEIKDYSTKVEISTYRIDNEAEFEKKLAHLIDSGPDGIIFSPHFVECSTRLAEQCRLKGIPVIYLDSNISSDGVIGYFGQNAFLSGYMAARLMSYGLQKNANVMVLKLAKNKASFSHITKREQGFLSFFVDNPLLGVRTISVDIDLMTGDNPETVLSEIFAEEKEISGIFITNSRAHVIAPVLKKILQKHILLIGYDLVEESIPYLEEGLIDFLICQKPEEQGYRSVMAMFNYLLLKKPVDRMNYSPIDIIMKDNYQFYLKNINNLNE